MHSTVRPPNAKTVRHQITGLSPGSDTCSKEVVGMAELRVDLLLVVYQTKLILASQ
jgi:hypothetical protein